MSEKIEINTMITKHENKCKDCRFDMIDVEDPLWEYGSPLKRVLIDNQTGETYDSVSKLVGLLNEQQVIIERLKKDNERLQQLVDVSMKADEVFSVFDDLKYIESALTFLIDNGLEDQCVECEREDIHFVAERLRIVLGSLDDE